MEKKKSKNKPTTLNDIRVSRSDRTLKGRLVELLNRESLSIKDMNKLLNGYATQSIISEIEILKNEGYNIIEQDGIYRINRTTLEDAKQILIPYYEKVYRCGIVTDTHGGSTHEQLTHLNTFYDICYGKGINDIFHAGDICAGIKMYKGQEYDAHKYGADPQKDWVIKNYPTRPGITTRVIAGNHDGSFVKEAGYDIVKSICTEREDMQYCGFMAGNIQLENGLKIEMLHPDGGVPYAQSYRAQKINEARGRGEDVPHISIYGHMHISLFNPYLGVYDICGGCFEGQTTYEKRKGLNPEIGGWILEVSVQSKDIIMINPSWFPFKEIKDDWKNY